MKRKRARFDTLVARYYPAVYTFASRLTDDPREAVLLTHEAFNTTRKQLRNRRNEVELVTTLLDAVIRAGFVAARFKSHVTLDKGKMTRLVLNCEERCMTSDYQEKGCRQAYLDKPKGDPQYIHTESGGCTKQSIAVGASPRQDRPTKAGKNAVEPKRSGRPKRKLSLKELSSLCRLAET